MTSLLDRIGALDFAAIEAELDALGHATTDALLSPAECAALMALYPEDGRFRTRVDMARHRFGEGDYAYFAEPLPEAVATIRETLYPPLAAVANRWAERLGEARRFPGTLAAYREVCAAAGQHRPTPLLLRYGRGGYNCLHRDVYGEELFPIQVAIFLSEPEVDYGGGAFLLVEQRPRAQSRGDALTPKRGQAILFPSAVRPIPSQRGFARAAVRHGVARLTWGARYTLGIIFHDAR